MHFTLSQSMGPTAAGLVRRVCLGIALFGSIAMAGAITGCDRIGASGAPGDSNSLADSAGIGLAADSSVEFVWPIDPNHPMLTLEVDGDHGQRTITIELMPSLAPATVAHVIDLVENRYYDGTTFHRVIPGFMIQGGDPNSRDLDPSNDGQGNPDLRVADEFGAAPFLRGVVGMGNKGSRNSTGGQFFIMHADYRNLDGRYTVIGRVRDGMDVVDTITKVSIDRIGRWGPKDRPIENVVMKSVGIEVREKTELTQAD